MNPIDYLIQFQAMKMARFYMVFCLPKVAIYSSEGGDSETGIVELQYQWMTMYHQMTYMEMEEELAALHRLKEKIYGKSNQ